jgi:hypothetical protein
VAGFRYTNHQKPCEVRSHKHKENGIKLRDYVNPPCQLEYLCEENFQPLYREIECRKDGIYDKKAFCVPKVIF